MIRFPAAVFLSAFLLFLVQPLAGKLVLPWFGGTPSVWTTCMLFFQVLLLAGYGWGHLVVLRLSPRRQALAHGGLLVVALAALLAGVLLWHRPLLPTAASRPDADAAPIPAILRILGLGVGLPYLVLAANGPLLQSWFARLRPGESPYRLYALSNLGSALGLLVYPFVLEPLLPLSAQAATWSIGFLLFAALLFTCARLLVVAQPASPAAQAPAPAVPRPPAVDVFLWIALAATASLLLLATTNEICQDVAVVPFLWVLPLLLYLLSFVVAFDRPRWYFRPVWMALLAGSLAGATSLLWSRGDTPLVIQVAVFSLALFSACVICHGEAVRLRPPPERLTGFYLALAAGGALGGSFAGLGAPLVFSGYFELHLGYVLAAILTLAVILRAKVPFGIATAVFVGVLGLAVSLGMQIHSRGASLVRRDRSFFGVLEVHRSAVGKPDEALDLRHGRIVHGFQLQAPEKRRTSTTYYTEGSGVALALEHHPRRSDPDPAGRALRVGLIGLGTGTMAVWGRAGDVFRFYEINSQVIALSASPAGPFTFVRDSAAKIEVVLGDGRVSLERELEAGRPQGFDVMVLDAFSGDAIPMHLLTEEAFRIYLGHLRDDAGIIAVHVTNTHLDLVPVVLGAAASHHLATKIIETEEDDDDERIYFSRWILVARDPKALGAPEIVKVEKAPEAKQKPLLWTDDFSDLARSLRTD